MVNVSFDNFPESLIIWPSEKYFIFNVDIEELDAFDLLACEKDHCLVFINDMKRDDETLLKNRGWNFIHDFRKNIYRNKLQKFLDHPSQLNANILTHKLGRQLDLTIKEKEMLALLVEKNIVLRTEIEKQFSIKDKCVYKHLSNLQVKLKTIGISLDGDRNGQFSLRK